MSFHHRCRSTSRSASAAIAIRAIRPSRWCCIWCTCRARPIRGSTRATQFRIGQGKLYAMTFADFEERIRDDLDRMLGPGGFSSARDIAAITVNRWPHGYSYVANSLFDPDDYDDTVLKLARRTVRPRRDRQHRRRRRRLGALAIDQAERAVKELLGLNEKGPGFSPGPSHVCALRQGIGLEAHHAAHSAHAAHPRRPASPEPRLPSALRRPSPRWSPAGPRPTPRPAARAARPWPGR